MTINEMFPARTQMIEKANELRKYAHRFGMTHEHVALEKELIRQKRQYRKQKTA